MAPRLLASGDANVMADAARPAALAHLLTPDLRKAWVDYGLLVFPGQFLTNEQQIAFAKRLGPLEFEMAALSNVKADGTLRREEDNDDRMKVLKGNMGWHMDSTYMPVQAKGAVFSAEEVPTIGGHTGFCDMRAAYDALDDATKAKVEKLSAYHSLHYSQAKAGHDSKSKADGSYGGAERCFRAPAWVAAQGTALPTASWE